MAKEATLRPDVKRGDFTADEQLHIRGWERSGDVPKVRNYLVHKSNSRWFSA